MTGGAGAVPRGGRDLAGLLAGMSPVLDDRLWAFCRAPAGRATELDPLMQFCEAEGTTIVVESGAAQRAGLPVSWVGRRITLTVHSDLGAVGFLATVSTALARSGIACNAIAALYHDHLFIQPEDAQRALQILLALEHRAPLGTETTPGVVYTVRVTLASEDADEWVTWMEAEHLPAVLATGCFLRCDIAREIEPAPSGGTATFVMDYRAASPEDYDRYRTRHAPGLQQASSQRFGGRFSATRSLRQLRPSQR